MSIKEKLAQYIKYKGISVNSFENSAGLSRGYYRKTNHISADALSKICGVYEDLSAEWLLRDCGNMLLANQSVGNITDSTVTGVNVSGDGISINSDRYEELINIVRKHQDQISEFQKQINYLIKKVYEGK